MGTNPNGFDPVEDWKHFIHPIKGILSQKCILQDSFVGQQQSFHRCNFHINIYKYKYSFFVPRSLPGLCVGGKNEANVEVWR